MGTPSLLLFLQAITEDSNLANFPGLVPAVHAFCWIHKAISLSQFVPLASGRISTAKKYHRLRWRRNVQHANLSRMLFAFAKTIDEITHSDWSDFVMHTAWSASVSFLSPPLPPTSLFYARPISRWKRLLRRLRLPFLIVFIYAKFHKLLCDVTGRHYNTRNQTSLSPAPPVG